MPLPLPRLDDRTYADLVADARSFIPSYGPDWTDHNPTDPGITLVELFAWLAEMLLFRADQITPEARLTFARLLLGPDVNLRPPVDPGELAGFADDRLRDGLALLRSRYRAVTADDYEQLALEVPGVARVRCVPRRHLEEDVDADRPGVVSVVVLPTAAAAADPAPVLAAVAAHLEPRRIITTGVYVRGPAYAPVRVALSIARRADVPDATVFAAVADAVTTFVDPLAGGPEGTGWPFGRDVYVSDLLAVVERAEGVDYVPALLLESTCASGEPECVAGKPIWHPQGDFVGIELSPHQLVRLRPFGTDPATQSTIRLSDRFVSIKVEADVVATPGTDRPTLRRALAAAVRSLFLAAPRGASGTDAWTDLDIRSTLRTALRAVPGVASADLPTVTTQPDRLSQTTSGTVALTLRDGELPDPETVVTLQ